jgi:rhodanese-related sulfurtransferase
MKKLLATIMLGIIGAGIASAGEFPDISIKELNKAIKEKKATVIDVNGSDSYKSGHVPSAIDFAANKEKIEKLLPKEKDALIVAYCGGPSCNAYTSAANAAKELGYTNVKHLSAGISGWKSAGQKLETVSTDGSVKKEKKGKKKKAGKKKKEQEKQEEN